MFRNLMLAGITATLAFAGTRDAQWAKVNVAIGKGLPATAITELEPILKGALENRAYGEAVKAIGLRIGLEGAIQGNKPEEKITRMQEEVSKAPSEMKPALECILANWYWQYFQRNRWRFMQRTQVQSESGGDLKTWDLPRILVEIDKHFTAALASAEFLKATPVSTFEDVLEKGSVPDTYRPTMFDFLAHNALEFYTAGEQAGAKGEDAFELDGGGPIFTNRSAFLAWKPEATDTSSPTFKAVRLFQELLTFHAMDKDRSALADVDLMRLEFGNNRAVGEGKITHYKAALNQFAKDWSQHEVSARALAALAGVLHGEKAFVEAKGLAERGMRAFPESAGGVSCFNLIKQIEQKSASIQTERVWNEPLPTLDVTYRNVAKVYFRAIEVDFEPWLRSRKWAGINYDPGLDQGLLSRKPVLEWQADLPPIRDFKLRIERLPAPRGLKPGFYLIVASHDPGFGSQENIVSVAPIWVSDLALVVRHRQIEGVNEGFVLNAITGEPIAGAKVLVWKGVQQGGLTQDQTFTTDKNGLFLVPHFKNNHLPFVLVAHYGGQYAVTANPLFSGYERSTGKVVPRTVFFTDRSIYRPGQTIAYKGICIETDQERSDYRTIPGEAVTVIFQDTNGKEIERRTLTCNGYGSFSGTFTAPRNRVMGSMRILAEDPQGATVVQVEEYKRPKFQVELGVPKEAAKLGGEVLVPGKALAYTGAAVGNAKVTWRVERDVHLPPWCWWGGWYGAENRQSSQSIAHGTGVTESDGSFRIQFKAKPDLAVPEKDEPVFQYTVHADVTDPSGETRSEQRTVKVAYTALKASISVKEWLTADLPVDLEMKTSTHDGEGESAEGTLTIRALKQPEKVLRPRLEGSHPYWAPDPMEVDEAQPEPSNPRSWEPGAIVNTQRVRTDGRGDLRLAIKLKTGIYRAFLESRDKYGKSVTARIDFQVLDPRSNKFAVKVPDHFASPSWTVQPGNTFTALWGTGYEQGRAFVEMECRGKVLKRFWTAPGATQEIINLAVSSDLTGGFTFRTTSVRANRAYVNERIVDVPWSDKELSLRWEHFTSKLSPGQKETWTAVVAGPGAGKAAAEMVATLYDASLDQFLPHDWTHAFDGFRKEWPCVNSRFENSETPFQHVSGGWRNDSRRFDWRYRTFDGTIAQNLWGYGFLDASRLRAAKGTPVPPPPPAPLIRGADGGAVVEVVASAAMVDKTETATAVSFKVDGANVDGAGLAPKVKDASAGPDLSKVAARKTLNETAFFFPHLVSSSDGLVRMEFTMPEALTEWKFLGFAHDQQMRSGFLTGRTVSAKDLMVEPNPPRFLREGDTVEFTVKVSNQSSTPQSGLVRLNFADAHTGESRDQVLGNDQNIEKAFQVPAKESRTYAWRVTVPDGCEFLTYKAVGAAAKVSDGEEGFLPVLSRRILVAESMPLPIRGKQEKIFEFNKLLESGQSTTLRQESLTLQMVSQPAWYAVMALPYLMEFPHECSEQTFNRLYANALARHIAVSDPKIRKVFDQWKATPSLDSPLEKNQDLKMVALEETPWLQQAKGENQARRNVGVLFDANRLDGETANTLRRLAEMQLGDGRWPWFPGGNPSDFITLYVVTGFGRLRHLGVDLDVSSAIRSLEALDGWMDENYRRITHRETYVPGSIDALYLYGRSFFLKDRAIAAGHREAVDFYLGQARKFWLKLADRQSQAHLAVALSRFSAYYKVEDAIPKDIMRSIKERSVNTEELGMFWREQEMSWWWYRAPIESQAMMIEGFHEVMGDKDAVEACQTWLLKQKQAQNWKTTKATADAIYALLLQGPDKLASSAQVQVSLGGKAIQPRNVEAGTGFYEERFVKGEVQPELGHIALKKVDEDVSWGSLHWQYLEDIAKVTPHEGTPLRLKKTLFIKYTTAKGQILKPVSGAVSVGDELVVRIELRADRDMEYIHLKDQRGSGTEPVSVLSRYKYQDGLAYYETTRDTASHFFIDYLPKGTYVFEYPVRIQLKGRYQTGIASIQSMYAPEFNSHSESFELEVR